MLLRKLLFVGLLVICLLAGRGFYAVADVNNYNPYQGWFWYKNPQKAKKLKKKQEKIPKGFVVKTYTYKQLWNMYPDQLKKILKLALKQAVRNPTPQNVKQYMILLDLVRRKAAAFTNVYSYVLQTNPQLNVYKDYPENMPGIRLRTGLISYDTSTVIKEHSSDYALLFFYKDGCPYCALEEEILKAFVDRYHWEVMPINIETQYNIAARFNINFVPEVILIHRGSPQWIPVSIGLNALNILERNVYRGIEYFEGKLSPQNWTIYNFQKNGSFNVKKLPVNPNIKFRILQETSSESEK